MDNCNLTLLTKEHVQPTYTAHEIFVIESQGSAVIDTACIRTACGENWLNQYLGSADHDLVKTSDCHRLFRFGDGEDVYSFKHASIPAKIGTTYCKIETEVVKSEIPLLLSKSSLKKAGTVLDLRNKPVELEFTSSGHYCINLLDSLHSKTDNIDEEVVLAVESGMTEKEKKRTLTKLHKQFEHASAERLSKLLKNAGTSDKQLLNIMKKVTMECEVCAVHKRPVARPVVGFPLATEYNETVAVDLHELEAHRTWYLHIIDEFTRFSDGCII